MSWPGATAVFFAYVVIATWMRRGVQLEVRWRVTALATIAIAGASGAHALPAGLLRHWIVPPIVLLSAYWTSGMLFVGPMPRVEAVLLGIDRVLGVCRVVGKTPTALAACLELAYASVYPLIPLALAIHLHFSPSPDPDRFWTVILVTDFICFGMLPWIQTRPPRAVDPACTWRAPLRSANESLLQHASIRANTFPSGHAAEAAAAALLILDAPAIPVILVIVNAAAVSLAAVLGRYHYAADAVLGWATAVFVVLIL